MHEHRHCPSLVVHAGRKNPLRLDPTRTTMLRRRFMADVNRRFLSLRKAVVEVIDAKDVLGIKVRPSFTLHVSVPYRAYEFQTDASKLASFSAWLEEQIQADIFSLPEGVSATDLWTTEYISSAYKQGLINTYLASEDRLFSDTSQRSISEQEFLRLAFNQPEAMSKVKLLGARAFEGMKGVTDSISTDLSRILAQGMIEGRGARDIARSMSDSIQSITKRRALVIARTEIINAHSEGQLDAFEKLGVDKIGVRAEWSTALDDRVCPACAALEGKVFTVKEARGKIPLHPNCRCAWIPTEAPLSKKRARR